MIKVLRILNRFNVGGPTHNAIYLTKHLYPDFETILIAGNKLQSEASSEYMLSEHGLNYSIIKNMSRSLNLYNDFLAFLEIRKIMKNFNPDVVHTHASKSGALGRLAAISLKIPVIVHTFHGHVFHSYFGKIKTHFYILVERFLAKRSSAIVAISELQKKELVEEFKICPEKKVSVIPLGFDLEKFHLNSIQNRFIFRKEFHIKENEVCIGIIGRLTPIKDHKFFIRAIHNALIKTNHKVKIFIIGDGEEKQSLIDFSNDLNLSISTHDRKNLDARIHFTSWRSDMIKVYAGLDIVALSSLNEGTPVTLIEAQASKKPVISTDVGGVRDIIEDGSTGLISPVGDHDSYVKNILHLIEDDNLRKSMGAQGYNNVSEKFSYRRLVSDMKLLYENIIYEKK
jgi:glycosyltransferase involved in cell wall biosynthesis